MDACCAAKAIFDAMGMDDRHRIVGHAYKLIADALDKARNDQPWYEPKEREF